MRNRLFLAVIPAAALLAVLPLVVRGPSCGHDSAFHLLNWLEVRSQWEQGVAFPRWEFTSAWNSGEPRFVFYPPLSWALGAVLGVMLPWAAVPIVFIWMALCACGFTMYRLAREWTAAAGALVAACFYMVHPYMLFTFFERSAYAELLAAAWIPLLLLSILRRRLTITGIAMPVALLWLTDDPAAVMGCYSFALLAMVRVAWSWVRLRQRRDALTDAAKAVAGVCLGLALSGFYLIPASVEQRWLHIDMENVPATSYPANFFFGHTGTASHIAILRTASFCSASLLLCIVVFGALSVSGRAEGDRNGRGESRRLAELALLLLTAALLFLLTAPSAPLWRVIPELKYLQFPWRFDAVLGAAAAVFLALALHRLPRRSSVAIGAGLAICLIGGAMGNRLYRQFCRATNGVPGLVAAFHEGALHDPTDEYTPATCNPAELGHDNPAAWIAPAPGATAPQPEMGQDPASLGTRLHFSVLSAQPAYFVINLRDYPAWRVSLNGKLIVNRPHRNDGLIVVPIPAGSSAIRIRYALTPDYVAGCVLTLLAALLLPVVRRYDRHDAGPRPS